VIAATVAWRTSRLSVAEKVISTSAPCCTMDCAAV
jgi:hypothetical protein